MYTVCLKLYRLSHCKSLRYDFSLARPGSATNTAVHLDDLRLGSVCAITLSNNKLQRDEPTYAAACYDAASSSPTAGSRLHLYSDDENRYLYPWEEETLCSESLRYSVTATFTDEMRPGAAFVRNSHRVSTRASLGLRAPGGGVKTAQLLSNALCCSSRCSVQTFAAVAGAVV